MTGLPADRRFRVWAPNAAGSVTLRLDDRTVDLQRDPAPGDEGWWFVDLADTPPGTRYRVAVDGGEAWADPRALRMPDGPGGPAELVDLTAYPWTDTDWRGVSLPGAVIYELHIGTFTPDGTLDAAIDRLDHLVDLGVDLVEVLPLASFPGQHGWGYDGVGLYAVHEPYGGPYAFQRFVDACHQRGLGVCLDVVYNHLGPAGDHLEVFGPYYTEQHTTPWGPAMNLDDAGSDEVRRFIVDNAVLWFRDFHVDALRLDAVHALRDDRATPLLEQLSAGIDALAARLSRPLWLIAESDRNDPRTVTPREAGGSGLHGAWDDDVHHALHVLLTGETFGYYADFTDPLALSKVLTKAYFHDGTWSSFRGRAHGRAVDVATTPGWRFVASLQTHDQVGNRALGDRLSAHVDPGLLAVGAALLLCSPFTPMLFMGEEWGASTPWQYFTDHPDPALAQAVRRGRRQEFADHGWNAADVPDPQSIETFNRSRLKWEELAREPHARLLRWYHDLIALRRVRPDLRDPRLDRVVVRQDAEARTVLVERGSGLVVANLGDEPAAIGCSAGPMRVLLAWDEPGTQWDATSSTAFLPARSAVVLG
ncbi:MAG: malto-oligosyltrehalose trehalohydrolase [Nocardioidaceae bacterium]